MQESSKLTFVQGMNTDADKAVRDGNSYLKAENFTSTSEGGGTLGALENAKGNNLLNNITFPVGHVVVGYTNVVDNTVYFTTDGAVSNIYYLEDDVLNLKYTDASSTSKLNFSLLPEHRIVAVGRQELTVLEKVYWVDGLNEYRYIDLNKDYTGKEATTFNSIPPNDLAATIATEVIPASGAYTTGKVYHSYQFYSVNGASSTISPASLGVNLSDYTGLKDGGNDKEDNAGCAVQVTVDNISTATFNSYNRIRIYAIFYQDESAPIVNIVAERNLESSSVTVVDAGNVLDTLELDQYLSYNQTTYTPEAITSKENNLLLGNLKESTFKSSIIDAWDSRAYRFIGPGEAFTYAEITDSETPSEYLRISNTTFKVVESTVPGINIGDDVPEDFDCANDYNNIYTKDLVERRAGTNPRTGFYKYQSNNTTLGGEGINVSYSFVDKGKYIETEFNTSIRTDKPVNNTEGDTYSNSAESALLDMQECQDGEVYRVGIKFFNSKGQASFVKWVGDILWEERYDSSDWGLGLTNSITGADAAPNYTGYKYSQYGKSGIDDTVITSRAKVLQVTITPPADPEITSWQVVRAERTTVDATVVGNGMLQQTLTDVGIERPSTTTYLPSYSDTKTLFKFSSPEFQFNNPSNTDFKGYKARIYNKYDNTSYQSAAITVTGSAYVAKTGDLKALSATGSSTFINLIDIEDSKWVTPHYAQDGIGHQDYTIGGYTFRNSSKRAGDDYGAGNSSYVLNLNIAPDIVTGVDDVGTENLHASILKNTDFTRYGGISYQDILNTVYIPFSDVTPITTTTQLANRGDVVSVIHYFIQTLYYDSPDFAEEAFQFLTSFPVQTRIDVRRRLDRILDFYRGLDFLDSHPTPESVMFIAETVEKGISLQGSIYDQDIGDLYRYNTVYSTQPSFEVSFPKPFDFIEEPHSTTKIIVSEKKINGEAEDQWTNFLVNNFIEVNSAYGGINTLYTKDNTVFFWQDSAFGIVAVNERSLISDSAGSKLALGTGGVLERYDYISDVVGNVDKYNVDASENGVFWIYSPKGRIYSFSDQLQELSTIAGVNTYLKSKDVAAYPLTVCDYKNNETLFRIDDEVLIYDWFTGTFTGTYTYTPSWMYERYDGNINSTEVGTNTVWEHNIEDSNRCTYYGTMYDSSFKHICANEYDATKTFDALSWHSTSTIDGVDQYEDTFSEMRVYTDYQNTQNSDLSWKPLNFSPDNTLRRKERSFTTVIPRDNVNAVQGDNVDIFDPANLDETQLFKRRIRDKYIVLDLKYSNDGITKFHVPYIDVYYRKSIR